MPTRSKDVDAIVANLCDWRGPMLEDIRRLVHEADPQITEAAKWKKKSNPFGVAVFEHNGIVCIGIPLKNSVRLVLAEGAMLPDPARLYNAQLAGNKTRAVDFFEGDRLKKTAVKALVRAGVKRNVAKAKKPARSAAKR